MRSRHYMFTYKASCPSHPPREAPPERGGYPHTISFTCFLASPTALGPTAPGRPRQSEEGIGIPYYLSGVVPLPPRQGGPARARRVSEHHTIYTASCPSHPIQGGPARARWVFAYHTIYQVSCPSRSSREAPPERGGHAKTMLCIRFRAPPAPPGRPRLSEEGIRKPCYLSGFVPLPLLQGGPA